MIKRKLLTLPSTISPLISVVLFWTIYYVFEKAVLKEINE